jgi:hypothetical protein
MNEPKQDRPTPETDANAGYPDGGGCWRPSVDGDYVDADFARTLERERDEAREDWRTSPLARALMEQAAEAREQRNMLAEALRPFVDGWSAKSCDSIVTEQQFRDARKALAAVKELAK